MFKIAEIQEVKEIVIYATPGWKDDFKQSLSQKKILPATFYIGKFWESRHICLKCNHEIIKGNLPEDSINNYLSLTSINNIDILDILGVLFGLHVTKGIKVDNSGYYYYTLNGEYKDIALLKYYRCQTCFGQYMAILNYIIGDEDRHPKPDKVYIEKILHVEFDHEEFMRMVMGKSD